MKTRFVENYVSSLRRVNIAELGSDHRILSIDVREPLEVLALAPFLTLEWLSHMSARDAAHLCGKWLDMASVDSRVRPQVVAALSRATGLYGYLFPILSECLGDDSGHWQNVLECLSLVDLFHLSEVLPVPPICDLPGSVIDLATKGDAFARLLVEKWNGAAPSPIPSSSLVDWDEVVVGVQVDTGDLVLKKNKVHVSTVAAVYADEIRTYLGKLGESIIAPTDVSSRHIVDVYGVPMVDERLLRWGSGTSTTPASTSGTPSHSSSPFVTTSRSEALLETMAYHIRRRIPLLVAGPATSGKVTHITHFWSELHKNEAHAARPIVIDLADTSLDSQSLVGFTTCSPGDGGKFVFTPGPLTQALQQGRWIIFTSIQRASKDVMSVVSALSQTMYDACQNGRSPWESYGTLNPYYESNVGLYVGVGRERWISARAGFMLIAVKTEPAPSTYFETSFSHVHLAEPTYDDVCAIVQHMAPAMDASFVQQLVSVYDELRILFADAQLAYRDLRPRLVTLQDLLRWTRRFPAAALGSLNALDREFLFLDACDIFTAALPVDVDHPFVQDIIAVLSRLFPQVPTSALTASKPKPTMSVSESTVYEAYVQMEGRLPQYRVGRAVLPIVGDNRAAREDRPFAMTQPTIRLLEQIAVAVEHSESVLLSGETGTGKTMTVAFLARQLGIPLVALNLSNQSEMADLVGGYKPVERGGRAAAAEIQNDFVAIFDATFNAHKSKNKAFMETLSTFVRDEKWGKFVALVRRGVDKIAQKRDELLLERSEHAGRSHDQDTHNKRGKNGHSLPSLDDLRAKITAFAAEHATPSLVFDFVEGPIVQSLRQGAWVLLDEVNLASAELLEALTTLVQSPESSLTLTERGDTDPVPRHPQFRLFACMNPATDVGKRDLPPALRSKFTEIWVASPDSDRDALVTIVDKYIRDKALSDRGVVLDVVETYEEIKHLALDGFLADGTNLQPNYSVRTLVRALSFAVKFAESFSSVRRACYEGFVMCFTMLLEPGSKAAVEKVLQEKIAKRARNPASFMALRIQQPPTGAPHVPVGGYYLPLGSEPVFVDTKYILSESVKDKLQDLARAIANHTVPVLIQGPTSAGKTSVIEYLAHLSGHRFVRINNHEHTDMQEYIGAYGPDAKGQLSFQDGVLVRALRYGYWIVLDELNLAPSDVLEALNRLLDDNRELVIPQTGEVVRPHPHFMLFATQNPPGSYGGRKTLSRAFRNRFLEAHFGDVPRKELAGILHQRCDIPPSHADKIVAIFGELQIQRQSDRVFEQKSSFVTLRDLFRWGERLRSSTATTNKELAIHGYMLLAEKARYPGDVDIVRDTLVRMLGGKSGLDLPTDYSRQYMAEALGIGLPRNLPRVVWTYAARRLFCLIMAALDHNEPVLLVGDTGAGKTSICYAVAEALKAKLHVVNCHQSTEAGDLLGSQRPVKDASKLFEWKNGPLTEAMLNGDVLLLDEVSLADDSVLERLNSVLESSRTLVLAEKGGTSLEDITVKANKGFQIIATMNPGGDYGKRELSPALRNRFTEIWVPAVSKDDDMIDILVATLSTAQESIASGAQQIASTMVQFAHYAESLIDDTVTLRTLIAWAEFLVHTSGFLTLETAFIEGAKMALLDGVTIGSMHPKQRDHVRSLCVEKLISLLSLEMAPSVPSTIDMQASASVYFGPYALNKGEEVQEHPPFSFAANTTRDNAIRIVRAMQLGKPILLEGSPGVGKTTLVSSIAQVAWQKLVRLNLSDQSDMADLLGSHAPTDSEELFAWNEAPFLTALQQGHWVLLDEMNLAPQPVLEGLNSILDHRGSVYIPELNETFVKHPNFRVFAAQNPVAQGGGRKGLPRSFVDRFSTVYLDDLTRDDYAVITAASFPQVDAAVIDRTVNVIQRLQSECTTAALGALGAPWEFNLRDLFRWMHLLVQPNEYQTTGGPAEYAKFLFQERFRTPHDKARVCAILEEELCVTLDDTVPFVNLTPAVLQVGHSLMQHQANSKSIAPLLAPSLPHIESIATCLAQGWLPILTCSDKNYVYSLVQQMARAAGQTLRVFTMSPDTDTMDLLGGYDQKSDDRLIARIADTVLSSCISREFKAAVRKCLSENADTKTKRAQFAQIIQEAFPVEAAELATPTNSRGRFEWVDGCLVRALERGEWLYIADANLCSPSVLDRLNSLFDSGRFINLAERATLDGTGSSVVKPHPEFRLIMSVNTSLGELSRAMRNRGVEIALDAPIVDAVDAARRQAFERSLVYETGLFFSPERLIHSDRSAASRTEKTIPDMPFFIDEWSNWDLKKAIHVAQPPLLPVAGVLAPVEVALYNDLQYSTPIVTLQHIFDTFGLIRPYGYPQDLSFTPYKQDEALSLSFDIAAHTCVQISTGKDLVLNLVSYILGRGKESTSQTLGDAALAHGILNVLRLAHVLNNRKHDIAFVKFVVHQVLSMTRELPIFPGIDDLIAPLLTAFSLSSGKAMFPMWHSSQLRSKDHRYDLFIQAGRHPLVYEDSGLVELLLQAAAALGQPSTEDHDAALSRILEKLQSVTQKHVQDAERHPTDEAVHALAQVAAPHTLKWVDSLCSSGVFPLDALLSRVIYSQGEDVASRLRSWTTILELLTQDSGEYTLRVDEILSSHLTAAVFNDTAALELLPLRSHAEARTRRANLINLHILAAQLDNGRSRIEMLETLLRGTHTVLMESLDVHLSPDICALFDTSEEHISRLKGELRKCSRSSVPLARRYIDTSAWIWHAYIPDQIIDPASALRASQKLAHELHMALAEQASAVHRIESALIGGDPRRNAILARLRKDMSTMSSTHAELDFSLGDDSRRSALLQRLFRDVALQQTSFARAAAALDDDILRESLINSSKSLLLRLANYAGIDDLLAPIRLALSLFIVGLALSRAKTASKTFQATASIVAFPRPAHVAQLPVKAVGEANACIAQLVRIAISQGGSTVISPEAILPLYGKLYTLWSADRRREEEAAQENASVFKKQVFHLEEPDDEAELRALFPTDDQESSADADVDLPDVPGTKQHISKSHEDAFAKVHALLFLNHKQELPWARKYEAQLVHMACSSMNADAPRVQSLDTLSSVFRLRVLGETPASSTPNFYHDSNEAEAAEAIAPVGAFAKRIAAIREIWPDQVVLQDLHVAANAILELPRHLAISRYLQKVEQLIMASDTWQSYASKEFSIMDEQQALVHLVIRWRRLELQSWSSLLDSVHAAMSERTSRWIFRLYEVLIVQVASHESSIEEYLSQLAAVVSEFLRGASAGHFAPRLALVDSFIAMMRHVDEPLVRSALRLVETIAAFFRQFAPNVAQTLATSRTKISKDIANVIKLASWRDTNVHALQQSSQNSHRDLLKCVRAYRVALRQPASDSFVLPVLPELMYDASNVQLLLDVKSSLPSPYDDYNQRIDTLKRTSFTNALLSIESINLIELSAYVIERSQSLKDELKNMPPSTGEDDDQDDTAAQRRGFLKNLLTQKKRALAEFLKELRRIGISSHPSEIVKARTKNPLVLYDFALSTRDDMASLTSVAHRCDSYYLKALTDLPAYRDQCTSTERSPQIVDADYQRILGSAESLIVDILSEHNVLWQTLQAFTELKRLSAHFVDTVPCTDVSRKVALTTAQSVIMESLASLQDAVDALAQCTSSLSLESHMNALTALIPSLEDAIAIPSHVVSQGDITLLDAVRSALDSLHDHLQGYVDQETSFITDPLLGQIKSHQVSLTRAYEKQPDVPEAQGSEQLVKVILHAFQRLHGVQYHQPDDEESLSDNAFKLNKELRRGVYNALGAAGLSAYVQSFDNSLAQAQHGDNVSAFHPTVAFLQTYLNVLEAALLRCLEWHYGSLKLLHVLLSIGKSLATEGFCQPDADTEEGEGGEDAAQQQSGGTGMADAETTDNAKDVTDELENEEQLEGLQGENNEQDNEPQSKEKSDAMDVENDFDAEAQDVSENEDDNSQDDESEDENEPHDEVGDVDPLDPGAVDEKFWNDDNKDDNNDNNNDDEQTADAGKQDSTDDVQARDEKRPEKNDKDRNDEEGDSEDHDNDENEDQPDEDDFDQQAPPENHANDMPVDMPEQEALDLPDDMQLDQGEDDGDEAGEEDDGNEDEDLPADSPYNEDNASDINGPDDSQPEDTKPDNGRQGEGPDEDDSARDEAQDDDNLRGDEETPQEQGQEEQGEEPEAEDSGQKDQGQDAPDEAAADDKATGEDTGNSNTQTASAGGSGTRGGNDTENSQPQEKPSDVADEMAGDNDAQNEQGGNAVSQTGAAKPGEQSRLESDIERTSSSSRNLAEKLESLEKRLNAMMDLPEESAEMDAAGDDGEEAAFVQQPDDEKDDAALGAATKEQLGATQNDAAAFGMPQDEENNDDEQDDQDNDNMHQDTPMPPRDLESILGSTQHHAEEAEQPDPYVLERETSRGDMHMPQENGIEAHNKQDDEDLDEVTEVLLDTKVQPGHDRDDASALHIWHAFESKTRELSFALAEQLRAVLTPTRATRLEGDYRTGKRLNMKKMVSFVASDFTKDKIWLRRTKASAREYQILLAIDDSMSMADRQTESLVFETTALLTQALNRLDVGSSAVCRFGTHMDLLHPFEQGPVSERAGLDIVKRLTFAQNGTNMARFVAEALEYLEQARSSSSQSGAELWQLAVILSDGVCEAHDQLRALLRRASNQKVLFLFVVLDSLHSGPNAESIVSLRTAVYDPTGNEPMRIERYLDTFPFDQYVILRDVAALPSVLSSMLLQFFERMSS